MSKLSNACRIVTMLTTASVALLEGREALAATWVMGTVQQAQSGTYFTEIAVSFTVPNPPTSGNANAISALWPGLENSKGDLIQPVLNYNEKQTPGWTMHNEVATLNGGGIYDNLYTVNPGDQIVTVVYLDTHNPGSGCNKATGANCNYLSYFADWTAGFSATLSKDWKMATGPTFAMGMVYEAPGFTYNSCADLPVGGFTYNVSLYKYTASNMFATVTPNFTVETPGSNFPFQFQNVSLNNGGNMFPNCMNITSPFNQPNESIMWLNAF